MEEGSKEKFNKNLFEKIEGKTKNNSLFSKQKYEEIMEKVEDSGKTKPKDYWAMNKFQLLTLGDTKRLVVNVVSKSVSF